MSANSSRTRESGLALIEPAAATAMMAIPAAAAGREL